MGGLILWRKDSVVGTPTAKALTAYTLNPINPLTSHPAASPLNLGLVIETKLRTLATTPLLGTNIIEKSRITTESASPEHLTGENPTIFVICDSTIHIAPPPATLFSFRMVGRWETFILEE